jgi:hypothetical protein
MLLFMPLSLFSRRKPAKPARMRTLAAVFIVGWGSGGLLFADTPPPAPASHQKSSTAAPVANVTKLQAWKDATEIASLAPGRTEVIGAGDSMKPVYGENTILVISKIAYEDLKPAMNVVYHNRRGKLVVHQLLEREASGWRVQGINNPREDKDRVTRDNLVGVVYASLAYSEEKR